MTSSFVLSSYSVFGVRHWIKKNDDVFLKSTQSCLHSLRSTDCPHDSRVVVHIRWRHRSCLSHSETWSVEQSHHLRRSLFSQLLFSFPMWVQVTGLRDIFLKVSPVGVWMFFLKIHYRSFWSLCCCCCCLRRPCLLLSVGYLKSRWGFSALRIHIWKITFYPISRVFMKTALKDCSKKHSSV